MLRRVPQEVVLRLVMQVQYAHEDHRHTPVYDGSDHRQQLATLAKRSTSLQLRWDCAGTPSIATIDRFHFAGTELSQNYGEGAPAHRSGYACIHSG